MVNKPSETDAVERRDRGRSRPVAEHAAVLGVANLNPFGDLHTLQHLSALFARSLRGVFEPLLRREARIWAEPLVVQRFADYRAERPESLTAWLPMVMAPSTGTALILFDGKFVLELLDQFFGGSGEAPHALPAEFSPAAEAMVGRLGTILAGPLKNAWEPLARIDFRPGHMETSPALLTDFDADDAVVVTRFGIAAGPGKPTFIDIIYPVSALKPHAPSLTGKVHSRAAMPDPAWRNGLTRAVMGVKFPVRSVLAEPMISLVKLMELKAGDVIPISFGADVPVMVGGDRLGTGTVGTSNGKAAIRLTMIERIDEEDYR
ncbi:flagellar motor switch protein FliM [Sphingomonas sp. 28-63-12]|uniref:flagellar motor switch protein FliM n=1 Tax=Sphingomonas sp. 28-63-12 TaxID=1970434 RepID=UPI000BD044FC|nr:MAG: flagellar motor switch protein FliM [Sphingomonas sp. 28-63-12]